MNNINISAMTIEKPTRPAIDKKAAKKNYLKGGRGSVERPSAAIQAVKETEDPLQKRKDLENMILDATSEKDVDDIYEILGKDDSGKYLITPERLAELKEILGLPTKPPTSVTPLSIPQQPPTETPVTKATPLPRVEKEHLDGYVNFIAGRIAQEKKVRQQLQKEAWDAKTEDEKRQERLDYSKRKRKTRDLTPEEEILEQAEGAIEKKFVATPEMDELRIKIGNATKEAEKVWRQASAYRQLNARTFKILENLNSLFTRLERFKSSLKVAEYEARREFEEGKESAKSLIASKGDLYRTRSKGVTVVPTKNSEILESLGLRYAKGKISRKKYLAQREALEETDDTFTSRLQEALRNEPVIKKRQPGKHKINRRPTATVEESGDITDSNILSKALNSLALQYADGRIPQEEYLALQKTLEALPTAIDPVKDLDLLHTNGKLPTEIYQGLLDLIYAEGRIDKDEYLAKLESLN